MNDLKEKLHTIIKTIDDLYLNTPVTEADVEMNLKDMGIDSLGRINLFYGIIDFYGVELDEEVAAGWVKLKDVLSFIEKL